MKRILCAVALTFALAFLTSGTAKAGTIALTAFSGGGLATSGSDQLYGWYFDTSSAISVTALGVGDNSGGSGLSIAHDVGIFRVSDEAMLVSTTVPAGANAPIDGFEYVDVSPYSLPADDYVIVMTMPMYNADTQSLENTSVTTSSPVIYVNSAFDSGSVLAYPNDANAGLFAEGLFGPNFMFASTSVPEPASATLILAGGLGLMFLRRRR